MLSNLKNLQIAILLVKITLANNILKCLKQFFFKIYNTSSYFGNFLVLKSVNKRSNYGLNQLTNWYNVLKETHKQLFFNHQEKDKQQIIIHRIKFILFN